jgi:mono/diheme cytochrome c family protein
MKRRELWMATGLTIVLFGCGHRTEQYVLPDEVVDFSALYENNCAACHGRDGRYGAARPLNDPVYLALIGKDRLRDVIAKGVARTAMPAFAQGAGGTLTDQQINILADQIEVRWSHPGDVAGMAVPPYSDGLGDSKRGESAFLTYCSTCHGTNGTGGPKGRSVIDLAFLALVSDQSLRTMVIAGRPDQRIPDWRSDAPGRVMTPQDISDVVAWLSAHRGGIK